MADLHTRPCLGMGVETLGLEREFTSDLESEELLVALFPQEALENVDIFGVTEDSEDEIPNAGEFQFFYCKIIIQTFQDI